MGTSLQMNGTILSKKFIEVESINAKGINLGIEDDGNYSELPQNWIEPEYKFEQLRGIPITPEILEKCGFGKKFFEHYGNDRNVTVFNIGDVELENFGDNSYQLYAYTTQVSYLHQLQNLYFALTQTELVYNP